MGELLVMTTQLRYWRMYSRRARLIAAGVLVLLGTALVTGIGGHHGTSNGPVIHYSHVSWTDDFTDSTVVASEVENIYVGEVRAKRTAYDFYGGLQDDTPATIYDVTVMDVLKGSLAPGTSLHSMVAFPETRRTCG